MSMGNLTGRGRKYGTHGIIFTGTISFHYNPCYCGVIECESLMSFFLLFVKFITYFLFIYNLNQSFFSISIPSHLCGLVQLPPNPHACGCADRFRTLLLAHNIIHDKVAVHHEKTPEDQTGHHWESSLFAPIKFKSLVTH